MSAKGSENRSNFWIILVNAALVCGSIAVFIFNSGSYRQKLQKQNIDDITNINQSSANISSAFFRNQQRSIADKTQYITRQRFSLEQAMSFVVDSNSDAGSNYELIGPDCKGFVSICGSSGFVAVDYSSGDYRDLKTVFTASAENRSTGIQCTQEFTDQYTAVKSFALYDRLRLEGSEDVYTLMAVFRTDDIAGMVELNGGYKDIATALITASGDYVLGSSSFKSDNLFKYFYDYSGLTLDEKNQAAAEFSAGEKNTFYFKNSQGEDCVFILTAVSGTQWFCVTCVPLSSFHSTGMDQQFIIWISVFLLGLMAFNITWMNRANHQLRVSVAREMEASAAKTEFLSRMSHDIRTPLNGIIGMTYLAREQENSPKTADYLAKIDTSSKFLLSLINDILDLSKAESNKIELHKEPYPAEEFQNYINSVFQPLCSEKKLKFIMDVEIPENICPVFDKLRINQVTFNLLSNAVKYTPEGGSVTLRSRFTHPDTAGRMNAAFEICDTGIGMSKEFQRHLFEPFVQESRISTQRGNGSGLGLSIAKKLVDLMGGTITVESIAGKGTTFFLNVPVDSVPLTEENGSDKKKTAVPQDLTRLAGKQVLLCEDQPLNREIMEAILLEKKMKIAFAENGQIGLNMFNRSEVGFYDLILMDVRMPVMDGLETTRRLRLLDRTDAKTVPIVAMTANAFDDDVKKCIIAGMNAHISKPVDPEKMFQVIINILFPND